MYLQKQWPGKKNCLNRMISLINLQKFFRSKPIKGFVEKKRMKGPEVCEESGPACSEDQNLKVVFSRPPTVVCELLPLMPAP